MSGRGEERQKWLEIFNSLPNQKIKIYFEWFQDSDYPLLCGSVDYGICFHDSVSKIDLPIKILDLFACEIPVIAYQYSPTIKELVCPEKNGYLFDT